MGITQLIDPFYKELDSDFRAKPTMGQLCWIPVCHLDPIPRILDVKRSDPKEHYATEFEIRDMSADDFKKKDRLPIKALDLRETEELIISRANKRPAIVVTTSNIIFPDMRRFIKTKYHLQEETIAAIPLYAVKSEEHVGGFPPQMAARIKAMLYDQFFFLPRKGSPLVYDSIARLDRIQIIRPMHPTYEPEQIALSDEALSALLSMLYAYLGAPPNEEYVIIRELCLETLPEEARP